MVPTFPDVSRLSVEPVLVRGIPVKLGALLTGNARNVPGAPGAAERWYSSLFSEVRSAMRDGQRDYARALAYFLFTCRARRGY
jgi:hypothetical protein